MNQKENPIAAIDRQAPSQTKTATFSMGCFWGPDALFGCMSGVIRTRVGYAGGALSNPTYHNLGNHIETIQIDYDPANIEYADLLDVFWYKHNPIAPPLKRQYASAVFYHDESQQEIANMSKRFQETRFQQPIQTEIMPFKKFYLAEDYHQKYYLQQTPQLMQEFLNRFSDSRDFINSTAIARVNGYVAGLGKLENLKNEIDSYGLSAKGKTMLLNIYNARK